MTVSRLREAAGRISHGASRAMRAVLRHPARIVRRELLPKLVVPARGAGNPASSDVRVIGLLSSASGVGKSARLCADVLANRGRNVFPVDVSSLFAAEDGIPFPAAPRSPFRGGVSIFHLNPSALLPGIVWSGLPSYYRSYNIGYWAWELECLPREWVEALDFVQAVMVPSHFCQRVVQRHTSKPVMVVPHPVAAPAAVALRPAGGPFRVLNVFRFGSSFERKNPIALVNAFRLAFGDDRDAELVLKTSYGSRYGNEMGRLLASVGDARNIRVIDEVWPEARMASLVGSADVYASLHRSEGFGLPIAEAIMAEVPVVATNWSGNVDFCPPEEVYPVDYDLVTCRDEHPDYAQVAGALWAEPSVSHAAVQLRAVREDPSARIRARRAKRSLQRYLAAYQYDRALSAIASGSPPVAPEECSSTDCALSAREG